MKRDAAEHISAPVGGPDLHEQSTVRRARAASIVAHPVRHETAHLGCRRNDPAAGAHTERVDTAPTRLITIRHRIVRDGEMRTARCCTVLHAVDELLCVLDAHTDGKGLRLHDNTHLMQHRVSITRRMPDAEKHCIDGNLLRVIHHDCSNPPRVHLHTCHLRAKAHLSPHALDLFAQILYHRAQDVCPDVRFLQITDFLGCPRSDECLDDLPHARVCAARRQFPIRERPRAPLTELHIRCRIEDPRLPEACHIRRPSVDILSALEDKRHKPCACEHPCGKDPRRTESNDNRPPHAHA